MRDPRFLLYAAQIQAAFTARACHRGCSDVRSFLEGSVLHLNVSWQGRPYEQTVDLAGQTPAGVDRHMDLVLAGLDRLTAEAQP